MGLFDGLLGLNSASNTDAATAAAMSGLTAAGQQGQGYLRGTTRQANDALRDAAGKASSALGAGYDAATGALADYSNRAQGALQTGTDKAVGTVLSGNQYYQPYTATGGAATGMLSKALGLAGPSGNAEATAAFQTSPGYGFQVDQATDAATRAAAAAGMGASGNTLSAVTRLGQNLANQEYGGWLDRLTGAAGQGLQGASGISSNDATAGGYQYGAGTNLANILQSTGSGLAGLDVGKGTGLAGIQTNLGNSLSGNYTGLGQGLNNDLLNVATNNANLGVAAGKADDTADNTNAGIFSKLFGGITGLPFGNATSALSTAVPAAATSTAAPAAAATAAPGGLFGPLMAQAGKSIAGYL